MADDRWLYAWALGYVPVGLASLLVPLYALSLGASAFDVGVLASTAAFAGVPGALWWGWLAERTGKRRVLVVVALGATSAVLVVMPLVASVPLLIAANALLWFVVAAAAPVLTLLVVDDHAESDWEGRIALLNARQGYGWVAGLVLGAAWSPLVGRVVTPAFAQRSLFWAGALLAALAVPLSLRWLPRETRVTRDRASASPRLLVRSARGGGRYVRTVPFVSTRLYWGIRSVDLQGLAARLSGPLGLYLAAVSLFSAAFAAFWGPLPAYLGERYTDAVVFWLFLATNLAAAAFYGRAGEWARRIPARRLQGGALGSRAALFPLVGAVVLLVPAVLTVPLLLVVFFAIGMTWAVIAVSSIGLVTRLGGDDRGSALGLYTALTGIGGGVGSLLGGATATAFSHLVTFALAGLAVAASALLIYRVRIESPRNADTVVIE